ncbi:1-aminocyclopropane-1-carboxylate deaminase/D-cysteine desulfhydrase [Microbulbifer sp. SA54]|uniref:1-aminocyclopropane-1-carboxylate deaminase/D-cysteine desulfhydrase n=1 Tax=Microbulbifer sp. SA54 TaxID=3401577 RepID=UPI003AB008F5
MIRYLTELSLDAFLSAATNVPYQQIQSELFPGIDLWVRRDDLIDPLISGNKAYKLIYNLLEARRLGKDTIVTCGGAWSNHIHATAAAGQRFGFRTIGIIRGERPPALSAMLQDAERFGMELKFVSRSIYRERGTPDFLVYLDRLGAGNWYVPEGGANSYGALGVQLLGSIITKTAPVDIDECWLACGTGLTLGALASVLPESMKLVGVPVLKAEKSIRATAAQITSPEGRSGSFELIVGADHGGYGKYDQNLTEFQREFESLTALDLDHVYTAKLSYALRERCKLDETVQKGRKLRVLLIHTGGLQGRRGLKVKWPLPPGMPTF